MNKLEYKIQVLERVQNFFNNTGWTDNEKPYVDHYYAQLEKWIDTAQKQIHRGKNNNAS